MIIFAAVSSMGVSLAHRVQDGLPLVAGLPSRLVRLFGVVLLASGCATTSAGVGQGDGLSFSAPVGWRSVPPDHSTGGDTVAVFIGPAAVGQGLAPTIEVSRRRLSVKDQRRPPAHVLTALATELMQTFNSLSNVAEPEDITVAGHPGARLQFDFSEMGDTGESIERRGVLVGVVQGGDLYVINCMVPPDGSSDKAITNFLAGLGH